MRGIVNRRLGLSALQERLLIASAVYLGFYAAGLVIQPSEAYLRLQSNVLYNLAAFVAFLLVAGRTAKESGGERWGWAALAVLLLTWQIGDYVYSIYDLGFNKEPPFPSPADAFYSLGYAACLIGLPLLTYPRRLTFRFSWLLDAVLVTVVAGCVQWQLVTCPVLDEQSSTFPTLLAASYPFWDLALLAIVAGGIFSSGGHLSPRSSILLIATLALAVTDSLFSYTAVSGYDNIGNPLELGWLVAYILIGFAATMPRSEDPRRYAGHALVPWLLVPYLLAMPLPLYYGIRAFRNEGVDAVSLGAAAVLVLAFVKLVTTIVQTGRAIDEERRRARTDSLTGLLNHGAIVEEAQALIEALPPRRFCLVLIDLDGLKAINDRFGHGEGDLALKDLARRLQHLAPLVGRYGGDEFLLLRPTPLDQDRRALATELTAALLQASDEPRTGGSASFGVAIYPDDARDLVTLLQIADVAMYLQKEHRRSTKPAAPVESPLQPRVV
jgi:diguanylate cyclase (GGDEF)-like protein